MSPELTRRPQRVALHDIRFHRDCLNCCSPHRTSPFSHPPQEYLRIPAYQPHQIGAARTALRMRLTRHLSRADIVRMATLLPGPFTVEMYHKLGELGIFDEDDRVELLDGQIVEMSPIGAAHAACVYR